MMRGKKRVRREGGISKEENEEVEECGIVGL